MALGVGAATLLALLALLIYRYSRGGGNDGGDFGGFGGGPAGGPGGGRDLGPFNEQFLVTQPLSFLV